MDLADVLQWMSVEGVRLGMVQGRMKVNLAGVVAGGEAKRELIACMAAFSEPLKELAEMGITDELDRIFLELGYCIGTHTPEETDSPDRCSSCGYPEHWQGVTGHWICAKCQPPKMTPELHRRALEIITAERWA